MPRDPDGDLDARKLELGLMQANLEIHRERWARVEHHLREAEEATSQVPRPLDTVSAILYAQAHAQLATAYAQAIDAGLLLERQTEAIEHERAHVLHAEGILAARDAAQSAMNGGIEGLIRSMREQGIEVEPQEIPGMGGAVGLAFKIQPPEDEQRGR